jgi:DNA-binding MarR family transcriptional regulator
MKKIVPREHSCYCIRIRRASNALTKYYDMAMNNVGLTISQFSLLNDIKLMESCNKSRLAEYSKLDRTTIIKNISVLAKKGYITEVLGPNNRNRLIQLTDNGEAAIAEGKIFWEKSQSKIQEVIGQENIEHFIKTLANIEALV